MDDLTTILKELTEKGYTNIETYFNDDHELILYCENGGNSISITVRINKNYDIAVFMEESGEETFKHDIDGHEVRKEILKLVV